MVMEPVIVHGQGQKAEVVDKKERRRIQNRVAQRKFRIFPLNLYIYLLSNIVFLQGNKQKGTAQAASEGYNANHEDQGKRDHPARSGPYSAGHSASSSSSDAVFAMPWNWSESSAQPFQGNPVLPMSKGSLLGNNSLDIYSRGLGLDELTTMLLPSTVGNMQLVADVGRHASSQKIFNPSVQTDHNSAGEAALATLEKQNKELCRQAEQHVHKVVALYDDFHKLRYWYGVEVQYIILP
ncbi:hypothetical protein F5Y01DRAFT_320963 [Xylaria sp. FL0043]|nr:hypothetical protein F5Y01DRAFT_320963 [Xylaria sp. FL0043]